MITEYYPELLINSLLYIFIGNSIFFTIYNAPPIEEEQSIIFDDYKSRDIASFALIAPPDAKALQFLKVVLISTNSVYSFAKLLHLKKMQYYLQILIH